jgi:hypothetical protein
VENPKHRHTTWDSTDIGTDANGNPATFDVANSYLGIRIGAFIFGGKN